MQRKEQPSVTALHVAQGLLACAGDKNSSNLVDEETRKLTQYFFDTALSKYPYSLGWLSLQTVGLFSYSTQKNIFSMAVIGYPEHCAGRKLFIEHTVLSAIKDRKIEQVLVIGGGFDPLISRLHRLFDEVHFFEVDRGETRSIKLEVIEKLNIQGKNLHFVECDLIRDKLIDKLRHSNFDPTKRTVAIAEGLLIYLSEQHITSLLKTLKEDILSENSIFITSFHETCDNDYKEGRASFRWYANMAKKVGESYHFALKLDQVPSFLHKNGFSLEGKLTNFNLQRQCGNSKVTEHTEGLVPENYVILKPKTLQSEQKIIAVPDIKIINNAHTLAQFRKETALLYSSSRKNEEKEFKVPVRENHSFMNPTTLGAGLGAAVAFYMGGSMNLLFRTGLGIALGAGIAKGGEKIKEYYDDYKKMTP